MVEQHSACDAAMELAFLNVQLHACVLAWHPSGKGMSHTSTRPRIAYIQRGVRMP